MANVKKGDTIKIHYTGKLEDGTVFDSSVDSNPLEFTVGESKLVRGLEEGVIGMTTGESRTITISPDQAYGSHITERVFELDRKRLPEGFSPEVGNTVQMYRADGVPVISTIIGISEGTLTMDCNHPLAGKTLIFDTTVLEIL